MAAVGMAYLLVIAIILLRYKLYKSITQRLFLYVVMLTTLKEALHFASIEHQWKYSTQEIVCTWIGFSLNVTIVAVLLLSLSLILYLLYQVYRLKNCGKIKQPKRREIFLEVTFVAVPILLSFIYSARPLTTGKYGLAGTWCWIKSVDENCTHVGLVSQMVFGHGVKIFVGATATIIAIVYTVIYFKLSSTFQAPRALLKKTLLLTGCLLFRILLYMLTLAARVVRETGPKNNIYGVSVTQALMTSISDLVFPLGFLLFFYSSKNLFVRAASILCCKRCKRNKKQRMYYNLMDSESETLEAKTIPISTRQSQPSESFFQTPHTDGFRSTIIL